MTDRKLSALCRATSVVPSKVKRRPRAFRYMLVEPVKDLLDAFVIGAVNRLVTVATVENQHFEPGGTVVGESAGVGSGDRLM